jgi:hypothetical protein
MCPCGYEHAHYVKSDVWLGSQTCEATKLLLFGDCVSKWLRLIVFSKGPWIILIVQRKDQESQSENETDTESDSLPRRKVYRRSLNNSWLEKFARLRYSGHSMYWKYCEETKKNNTYTVGYRNFWISDIQKHSRSRGHVAAAKASLLKVYSHYCFIKGNEFEWQSGYGSNEQPSLAG